MAGKSDDQNALKRRQIVDAIQRLSREEGKPIGYKSFAKLAGFGESEWRGVYWPRWGDALIEAGLTPNAKSVRAEETVALEKIAVMVRHFGRFPTISEWKIYKRSQEDFPNPDVVRRRYGSHSQLRERLIEWAKEQGDFVLVAALGESARAPVESRDNRVEGFVYLIGSGTHYKIGRSDQLERRVKEIKIALPEEGRLVHSISTDDPSGIESYWHRRFADRRANGEWFRLSVSDVKAFKRRKFQ